MRDGVSDMHCMSDLYLAEELKEEYDSKNLWLTCDKGKNGSGNLFSMRVQGQGWNAGNFGKLRDKQKAKTEERCYNKFI